MDKKIAVIGAGSWGTALAKLLSDKGLGVVLWAFEASVADNINRSHINPLFLSDIVLPKALCATNKIEDALRNAEVVVSAVPSHALKDVWSMAAPLVKKDALIVSTTKGIDAASLKLMSEVLSDALPAHSKERLVVLSGPSFAHEVSQGKPTSVVIAGKNSTACRQAQELFRTDLFLTFTSDDVVGVEVGGAVKNVIAIATGIADGLKLGNNGRAAIITRGLYEMIKIGKALGANPLTFTGLSGIGDLVLTCTADLSRNHTVGKEIASGKSIEKVLNGMKMVAEGVPTAKAIHTLAIQKNINAPICAAMFRILYEKLPPKKAVEELCSMTLKEELGAILS